MKMNKKPALILIFLGAAGLLPLTCSAILTPASANGYGPTTYDTSTLGPNVVNGGNDTPTYFTGQCPWITSTMNTFVAASGGAYTWQWGTPTFNLQADLSVPDYYAWVNTSPNSANGFALSGGVANTDSGGADFGLTYNPTSAGSPTNVYLIQSYMVNKNGTITTALDTTPGSATPWYGGASSGPAYGGGGTTTKMGDEPLLSYSGGQAPLGINYNDQFQVAVAVDNVVDGVNNLTLYQGEEWWGFTFTTAAVPEPSTCALVMMTLVAGAWKKLRSLPKT